MLEPGRPPSISFGWNSASIAGAGRAPRDLDDRVAKSRLQEDGNSGLRTAGAVPRRPVDADRYPAPPIERLENVPPHRHLSAVESRKCPS